MIPAHNRRRRVHVIERLRNRINVIGWSDHILGVAAIDVISGEERVLAQILRAAQAVLACLIGPVQPGQSDAIAFAMILHAASDCIDDSDDLMAWDNRPLVLRKFAFHRVQVGMAQRATIHTNAHLSCRWVRHRQIAQ